MKNSILSQCLLSFLVLAGCQAGEAVNPTLSSLTDASSEYAGEDLFNSERLLLSQPIRPRSPVCNLTYYSEMAPITAYRDDEVGVDHDIESIIPRHYTGLGIAALSSERSRTQLKNELVAHARAKSFVSFSDEISVNRMIQPVMVAYGHNKSAFSEDEQRDVEQWFASLLSRVDRMPQTRSLPRLHNVTYRNALNQMILGVVSNDTARVNRAIAVYKNAIDGMRTDGSFPNDSQRGGSSLSYQSNATATLVTIAEIAANQNIDLYSYGGNKTIATAVRFTIDATNDPSLIYDYARSGPNGGELYRDDPNFPASNPSTEWSRISRAEFGMYWLARFPNSPEATKIRSLPYIQGKLNGRVSPDWDFQWDVGGSASCFTSGI